MEQALSMDEIRELCPLEWVLLGDPETTPGMQITRARLLWHGPDRDELHRAARRLKPKRAAVLYTGPVCDEGVAYVL